MTEFAWGNILAAALSAATFVKILDILYQEYGRRRIRAQTAEEFVDQNLGPLLKAADELTGKLRALAENDFRPIHNITLDDEPLQNSDFASVIYLFGRFWAQVESFRSQGMSVATGRDDRGAKLQHFLDCLESRRVRIIDRILQRAIGEVFLDGKETITFVRFVEEFDRPDSSLRHWTMPLALFLSRLRHTSERQLLLQYGVVIHALIDALDAKHLITRDRPGWPNKLTARSWADLNYRVFGRYLAFVSSRGKYIGPPKKAARKGRQLEGTLRPKP